MNLLQIILIAVFIYLGSIGSVVGNTIGWYTLGRPLIASFVVGLILGDLPAAMTVGIALQIMYMGNVTPGGAVAWDLSYATYIGTAGALVFGAGMETTRSSVWQLSSPESAVWSVAHVECILCPESSPEPDRPEICR